MYLRTITPVVEDMRKYFPIIGITGPRQSGKTTLAKVLFKHLPYVSLENLDTRTRALDDPRAFLAGYPQGAIFDEIQHVPALFSYLQEIVDNTPEKGLYVFAGSQNFTLNQHITQSLSGRIGMVTLLPLSLSELGMPLNNWDIIFKGGCPGLHHLQINPLYFYPSYVQTYLERDVRQLKNTGNYTLFQKFLKLCAGRIGQVVNFSTLAQDTGIAHTTARNWVHTLEAGYIAFSLPPYYKNFNKRVIKMSKLYFYDTGLACALLGIENMHQLDTHYMRGALLENLVILELLKQRFNQGLRNHLYFWRDRTGHEVDLLIERGGSLCAIEIKASMTFKKDFVKGLQYFCKLTQAAQGYLVYQGTQTGSYKDIGLVPIQQLHSLGL